MATRLFIIALITVVGSSIAWLFGISTAPWVWGVALVTLGLTIPVRWIP